MKGHYHAVIWIDHRQARVLRFSASDVDKLVVTPEDPVRHLHHKANSVGSGHAPEDQKSLEEGRQGSRGCRLHTHRRTVQ